MVHIQKKKKPNTVDLHWKSSSVSPVSGGAASSLPLPTTLCLATHPDPGWLQWSLLWFLPGSVLGLPSATCQGSITGKAESWVQSWFRPSPGARPWAVP